MGCGICGVRFKFFFGFIIPHLRSHISHQLPKKLPLLESEAGNTEVTVYHPAVIRDGFFVVSTLVIYQNLAVIVLFSLLDGPFLTEELDPVFKGDTRNALKTFNKLKLVKLVAQAIYFFDKILFR